MVNSYYGIYQAERGEGHDRDPGGRCPTGGLAAG